MSSMIAPEITYLEMDAARTLTTESVMVYGIQVCNQGTPVNGVSFTDNDGNILLVMHCIAKYSTEHTVPFIADNGLIATATGTNDADLSVTIAHSSILGGA
jgi:hypothetical protein